MMVFWFNIYSNEWIINFKISIINFLPLTKKNLINLIKYIWNIVKNVIVIDLPLKIVIKWQKYI